jgi:structural maintenance of chromosomes protein 5
VAAAQAKVDSIVVANTNVIQDYENALLEIAQLQKQTDKEQAELDNKMEELQVLKATWVPQVKEIVLRISERFSGYFAQIGCAGEVSLNPRSGAPATDEGPQNSDDSGEDDFKYYGLEILVKYRDSAKVRVVEWWNGGE